MRATGGEGNRARARAFMLALALMSCPASGAAESASGAHIDTAAQAEQESKNAQLNQLFQATETRSYVKARIIADRLLKLFPNDPPVHLANAALFLDMGQISNAEGEYKMVLKMSPRSVDAMVALSQIALQKFNADQALTWARLAANTNPRSMPAKLALLRALVEAGLLREGNELVQQLLKEDKSSSDVQYAAYKFYLKQGQFQLAQEHLENAIRIMPRRFDWLVDLSDIYKTLGDYSNAQSCLERALEIDQYSLDALNKLAIIQEFFTYEYDHAIETYKRILGVDPESVTALAGLDRCKVKKNDLAGALRLQVRGLGRALGEFFKGMQQPPQE